VHAVFYIILNWIKVRLGLLYHSILSNGNGGAVCGWALLFFGKYRFGFVWYKGFLEIT